MAAGTALTTEFLMGAATLMIGTQAEAMDLLPATHSLGLVKNFTVTTDPNFATLTQGTKNTEVYSTLTGNAVKASAEVYEYTAKNLAYGLALDGGSLAAKTTSVKSLTAAIVSGDTTMALNNVTGLAVNDYIMISDSTQEDVVLVRKITNIASLVVTVDNAVNSAWATTTTIITEVNAIDVGSTSNPPFLSAKATGILANGTPISIVFPKIRVTKGFNLAFQTQDFGNMPFEISVMDLVPSDPFYSSFPNRKALITRQ